MPDFESISSIALNVVLKSFNITSDCSAVAIGEVVPIFSVGFLGAFIPSVFSGAPCATTIAFGTPSFSSNAFIVKSVSLVGFPKSIKALSAFKGATRLYVHPIVLAIALSNISCSER